MPKHPAKPKTASRTNDPTVATYSGQHHNEGRCQIGRCDYTLVGIDYNDARSRMAGHREVSHA